MTKNDTIVAVFSAHDGAETAIRELAKGGLDMKHFSIVGKGYHSDETVVGFYNAPDRIKIWGQNGAIWGGIWGLFVSGLFVTVPVIGPVVVLGHLAAMVVMAVEGAVVVGGLGAIGGALFSIGIPKDSVIKYEEALKADGFLVVAHGPVEEMTRAKSILEALAHAGLDIHADARDATQRALDSAAATALA